MMRNRLEEIGIKKEDEETLSTLRKREIKGGKAREG